MKNILRILLATIIMPAYLIADEADEPASPPKADEVEVKENDENDDEVIEDGSEDPEGFSLPGLTANDIAIH